MHSSIKTIVNSNNSKKINIKTEKKVRTDKKLLKSIGFFLLILLTGCRSEFEPIINKSISQEGNSSAKLSSSFVSLKTLRNEINNFDEILNKSSKSKNNLLFAKNNNFEKVYYRKIINYQTGNVSYTLTLNSYSIDKPYHLIQQIVVTNKGKENVRYLKIIPDNLPKNIADNILKNLSGSIELFNENMDFVTSTKYINGQAQIKNKTNGISSKNSIGCDIDIITVEIPCSNGGGHGVGQNCASDYTNDAHYETTIYISCPKDFGPSFGGTFSRVESGGNISGGIYFDQQLNNLLANRSFIYSDYITDSSRNLLLNAVRSWLAINAVDTKGDLSILNNKLQFFANNDQIFANIEAYNRNTPNVANAEVTDYSIRIYDLIKWLLDNPSDENAKFAIWSVIFFDQNRFVSWEEFESLFLGKADGNDGGETFNINDYSQISIPIFSQLPRRNDFYNAFPKIGISGMKSSQVYKMVGGHMYSAHLAGNPNYQNACAIRVSRALNYAGQSIPVFYNNNRKQKSEKGNDNKNYILDASSLLSYMLKAYPSNLPLHLQNKTPQEYLNSLKGKWGIYIMIPKSTKDFGASGHADFFSQNGCLSGCYFQNAKEIYFWELN